MSESTRVSRVLLLGFMCSGKSTVGRSLARRLEWDFIDFDAEIEVRTGVPIVEIIDARGEEYFRRMEIDLTAEIAGQSRVVLAPGGGWITNKGLLESLRPGTLSVWLEVSARETVRRLREDPKERPFKHHPDPQQPIEQMLSKRESLYRLADHNVPSDSRTIESIAFELEQLVRLRGATGAS